MNGAVKNCNYCKFCICAASGISSSQSDKSDDSKLNENGTSLAINAGNSALINSGSKIGATNPNSDLGKEGNKDETAVSKE